MRILVIHSYILIILWKTILPFPHLCSCFFGFEVNKTEALGSLSTRFFDNLDSEPFFGQVKLIIVESDYLFCFTSKSKVGIC